MPAVQCRFISEKLALSTNPEITSPLKAASTGEGGIRSRSEEKIQQKESEDSECYKHGKWNEMNQFSHFSNGKESNKLSLIRILSVKYICYFLRLCVTFLN